MEKAYWFHPDPDPRPFLVGGVIVRGLGLTPPPRMGLGTN